MGGVDNSGESSGSGDKGLGGMFEAGGVSARVAGPRRPFDRSGGAAALQALRQRLHAAGASPDLRRRVERLIRLAVHGPAPAGSYHRTPAPGSRDIVAQEFVAGTGGGSPGGKV